MDGTEPGLNHHPKLNQKISPHPSQFRKFLSPSKSHENTSNASDIPFVIIPGELYRITSPHRGDLNKCPNLLPDPSPSVGGTAGSPQDVPVPAIPVSVRRAWLHLVLPSRACPMPSQGQHPVMAPQTRVKPPACPPAPLGKVNARAGARGAVALAANLGLMEMKYSAQGKDLLSSLNEMKSRK